MRIASVTLLDSVGGAHANNSIPYTSGGVLVDDAGLQYDGTAFTSSSVRVSDLATDRVAVVTANNQLSTSNNLQWDGSTLTVSNLTVNGTTTTINTSTLVVEDKDIVVNNGGTTAGSAGSGILIEGDSDTIVGFMRVDDADNTQFEFKAPGSAFTMTLDINANSELTMGGDLNVEANSAINQDVTTDASPTFSDLTLSSLTANRVVVTGVGGAINTNDDLQYDGTQLSLASDNALAVGQVTAIAASAIFEVESTTRGALLPRMSTTQRDSIASPVDGLIIYNTTTDRFNWYDGIQWLEVGSSAGATLQTAYDNSSGGTTAEIVVDSTRGALTIRNNATPIGANLLEVQNNAGNATYFAVDINNTTMASAVVSDLTSGRVTYAGASGALVDNANMTFDGTDLTVASAVVSDLTSGRVTYAGASGALVDNANMTFDGTDLTVASAVVSDLTSGRITYAGASGALVDNANLTFSGTTLVVNVTGGEVIGDSTLDASAILELESSTKGFLAPRMTTTERDSIAAPATGLWIYNESVNQFNFYDGTNWEQISSGSGNRYEEQFTDPGANTKVVTHNLGLQYVQVVLYDEDDKQVIPDDVTATSTSAATLDLTALRAADGGTIAGTWTVVVLA